MNRIMRDVDSLLLTLRMILRERFGEDAAREIILNLADAYANLVQHPDGQWIIDGGFSEQKIRSQFAAQLCAALYQEGYDKRSGYRVVLND